MKRITPLEATGLFTLLHDPDRVLQIAPSVASDLVARGLAVMADGKLTPTPDGILAFRVFMGEVKVRRASAKAPKEPARPMMTDTALFSRKR